MVKSTRATSCWRGEFIISCSVLRQKCNPSTSHSSFLKFTIIISLKNFEDDDDLSNHQGYTYDSAALQSNSLSHHLRDGTEHLPHACDPHQGQNYQYEPDDCVYSSAETAESNGINNLSTEEGYEQDAYPHSGLHHGAEYHGAEAKVDAQVYGEHVNVIKHFQVRAFNPNGHIIQLLM